VRDLLHLFNAIGPPFLLLLIGGFARKKDYLSREADRTMSRFIVYMLYPCFILYHILGSDNPVGAKEAWISAVFGFCSISVGFLVSRCVGKICMVDIKEMPAFCFCSGIFNYGFFAIPIAALYFGNELVVKIILFNLGVEVAIWTVGILFLTSSKFKFGKILNPPVLSVLIALILQILGGKELFPQYLWEVLSMIGNCSIPMALMIIGASFYDLFKGFRPSKAYRVEMAAFLTRGLIVPALFVCYAVYGWIPSQASWMADVLIVQAAMPAGVFALVVVKSYGQDTKTALRVIMATMLISLVSLPAWLWLGIKLISKN